MSRVSLKVSSGTQSDETVPGYSLTVKNVSLNELQILQNIEEILSDCFDFSRISVMKLEGKLDELKESYGK